MQEPLQHNGGGTANANTLFPVFLKLEDLRLLIVGGGPVALEKLNVVLQNAPLTEITIVATSISKAIHHLSARFPNILLIEKDFEDRDLDQKDLVIVAVNQHAVSKHIREASRSRNLLVNVADTPALCDFYLGAIVQKGTVKIAISTGGQSPTLAKRLKEFFHEVLPADIHELANQLNALRNRIQGSFQDKVKQLNELTKTLSSAGK